MSSKSVSTALSAINAKIDSVMADQRKLLAIAPQPSIISGSSTDRQLPYLWTEIEKLHRDMAEQKLFYENQLAESRSEAEKAIACQQVELKKMRDDFSALQETLTSKISELAAQKSTKEFSKSKVDAEKAEFHRIIDLAFEEYADLEKTDEKVRRIYEKTKKDKAENYTSLVASVQAILLEGPKVCFVYFNVFHTALMVISREKHFPDLGPSLEYVKLLLVLYEYSVSCQQQALSDAGMDCFLKFL
jgi:hypothetical protein